MDQLKASRADQLGSSDGVLTDYKMVNSALLSLIDGVPHKIANLANAAACLYTYIPDISWAGFYLVQDDLLVLGPFQGKPACIEIKKGRGVCGTAYQTGKTQVVYDVHKFEGHIACDSDSASEIVIPLYKDGKIAGVLDIDSKTTGRFTGRDKRGLEKAAEIIETVL